jgi:ADP-heptose:LPS heptosyltransferase
VAAALGRPVLLVEGPADAEACRLFTACAPPSLSVARAAGLTVAQIGALAAECRLFLGNDSGTSHLAAALGVPTVAIFGPTDPGVWAPRGRDVRVVSAGEAGGWPTPEDVLHAIRGVGT